MNKTRARLLATAAADPHSDVPVRSQHEIREAKLLHADGFGIFFMDTHPQRFHIYPHVKRAVADSPSIQTDAKPKRMKRASYREAIQWIAVNDEAGVEKTEAECGELVSSVLVADLFDVTLERVGRDVYKAREKAGRPNKEST
jgi:hypothetical protein